MIKDYQDQYYYHSNWEHWYTTFNNGVFVLDDFGTLIKIN